MTRHMRTPLMALLVCATLAACTVPDQPTGGQKNPPSSSCGGDLGAKGNTRLAAIQQMVDDNKPHAALAELDGLGERTPMTIFLRAEAWRRIERGDQARPLYTELAPTCLAGQAAHGLGLLAAREGRIAEGLQSLEKARNLRPTDAAIRNDLGYALLLDKQWDAAQFELLTAMELMPGDAKPMRNLVLLALAQGKPDAARRLIEQFKIDAPTAERLNRQAQTLQTEDRPPRPP
jgi:Flp pilus assembly protein TadD